MGTLVSERPALVRTRCRSAGSGLGSFGELSLLYKLESRASGWMPLTVRMVRAGRYGKGMCRSASGFKCKLCTTVSTHE